MKLTSLIGVLSATALVACGGADDPELQKTEATLAGVWNESSAAFTLSTKGGGPPPYKDGVVDPCWEMGDLYSYDGKSVTWRGCASGAALAPKVIELSAEQMTALSEHLRRLRTLTAPECVSDLGQISLSVRDAKGAASTYTQSKCNVLAADALQTWSVDRLIGWLGVLTRS